MDWQVKTSALFLPVVMLFFVFGVCVIQILQGLTWWLFMWTTAPASSQALPALKVAIDDECLGKGLVFTKNNPPDFGLLFLAQFARFSIRTETEVTVHTHSETNRHLRLRAACFGFSVGNRKFEASKVQGLDL